MNLWLLFLKIRLWMIDDIGSSVDYSLLQNYLQKVFEIIHQLESVSVNLSSTWICLTQTIYQPLKTIVWFATWLRGIIGSYFFANENVNGVILWYELKLFNAPAAFLNCLQNNFGFLKYKLFGFQSNFFIVLLPETLN